MAIGTVSSISGDNWQLVSTNPYTSATSVTASGLTGYKKYMIVWNNTAVTTADNTFIRFNSDSTAGNYISSTFYANGSGASASVINQIITEYNLSAANVGYVIIDNADKSVPKEVTGYSSASASWIRGLYNSTSPITSVTYTKLSGTFTGTLTVYGIAA